MSKAIPLAIVAAVVALAVVLNPSPEAHREKIKSTIAERSQLEKVLGIGHLTSFVAKHHSLGVASYNTVNDKLVSVGVLGMVFVTD